MFRPAPVGQTQSTVNGVRLFLFEYPQMVAASLSNMQVWRRTVNCGSLYPEVFYLQSILWSPGLKSSMKIVTLGHQLPSQKSRLRNSGLKQKNNNIEYNRRNIVSWLLPPKTRATTYRNSYSASLRRNDLCHSCDYQLLGASRVTHDRISLVSFHNA